MIRVACVDTATLFDGARGLLRPLLLATAALACSMPALAADKAAARSDHDSQRARCLSGQSHQDRATCLREAAAAREESRRGGLTSSDNYRANALSRCDRLPSADQAECRKRIGQGSASGSVEAGGVLREHVTREVAPQPARPASR